MNKLFIIIGISVPAVIIIITGYFEDIELTLKALVFLSGLAAVITLIILNPFVGMVLLIAYKPISYMVDLPYIHTGGRELFLLLLFSWFLKYILQRKTVFYALFRSNSIILIFLFSICISSILAVNPKASFIKVFETSSYIIMCFFIMQDVMTDRKKMMTLVFFIALSISVVSLLTIKEYIAYGIDPHLRSVYRFAGIYSNPNALGYMMAYGIPFILFLALNGRSLFIRIIFSVFFLSVFFALGISVSRNSLIQFLVFTIAYLALSFRYKLINAKQVAILVLIICIIGFMVSQFLIDSIVARAEEDVSESMRYYVFLKGISLLGEHPLFGVGLENYQYTKVNNEDLNTILSRDYGEMAGHDILSRVFASVGLVGTTILLIIFYKGFSNFYSILKNPPASEKKYFLSFAVNMEAGYIGLLSSAIGTSLIFNSQFWIYYSLSVLLMRWRTQESSNAS